MITVPLFRVQDAAVGVDLQIDETQTPRLVTGITGWNATAVAMQFTAERNGTVRTRTIPANTPPTTLSLSVAVPDLAGVAFTLGEV